MDFHVTLSYWWFHARQMKMVTYIKLHWKLAVSNKIVLFLNLISENGNKYASFLRIFKSVILLVEFSLYKTDDIQICKDTIQSSTSMVEYSEFYVHHGISHTTEVRAADSLWLWFGVSLSICSLDQVNNPVIFNFTPN